MNRGQNLFNKIFRRQNFRNFYLAAFGFGLMAPVQSFGNVNTKTHFSYRAQTATFDNYLQTPLRQQLLSPANNGMYQPSEYDASAWTGCSVGKGQLVGTFRDISACAASAYYGRDVSAEELAALTYEEATCIVEWIWNRIDGNQILNQDVANITMHVQMHYGNIKHVQAALNSLGEEVVVDGLMGQGTLTALNLQSSKDPIATYNAIRAELRAAYEGEGIYRQGFLRLLDLHFPEKNYPSKFWEQIFLGIRYFKYVLPNQIQYWIEELFPVQERWDALRVSYAMAGIEQEGQDV